MTARILIVDDVEANTKLLQAKLAAEYYHVKTTQDGFEALRVAASWQPDLILLDVMMPGIDGYQTCRRLKTDGQTMHIPVVMITALGDTTERLQGLEVGADDFLTKPVDYDTLLARLRGLVRLKRLLDEWRMRSDTAAALGLSTGPQPDVSAVGARALVVDDWDAGALATQGALGLEGIASTRAHSESEALALSGEAGFDLVVLSLSMTGDNPLRLASRLLAEQATQATPLLLIADPDQRERLLRGFDLGANDWVLRPVDDNELRVRARNQIRRKFYQDRLRTDLSQALELALTDPLTGLYNQRYLMRHLAGLIGNGQPPELVALMIDIDHFKSVNDRWGHANRRPRAAAGCGHPAQPDPGVRQPGALRRGGVRGDHVRRLRHRCGARGGTAARRDPEHGVHPRREDAAPADRQHRGVAQHPGGHHVPTAARRGGPRAVSRQAPRPQPRGSRDGRLSRPVTVCLIPTR